MATPNIVDAPEVELLRGIELLKVSPRRRHARLQGLLFSLLDRWAGTRGEVATEWRFRLSVETSLVPDVAYVPAARLTALDDDAAEEPSFSPAIAVEIRSPGDRERNISTKIAIYLAGGAELVLDVDPELRRIAAHDGRGVLTFSSADDFAHDAAPGLTFSIAGLFAAADRRRLDH